MTSSNIGLFIFRRDLRLSDNTSLKILLQTCSVVYPIFIFTPTQVDKNPFKSEHSIQFMIESLCDLENQIESNPNNMGNYYEMAIELNTERMLHWKKYREIANEEQIKKLDSIWNRMKDRIRSSN